MSYFKNTDMRHPRFQDHRRLDKRRREEQRRAQMGEQNDADWRTVNSPKRKKASSPYVIKSGEEPEAKIEINNLLAHLVASGLLQAPGKQKPDVKESNLVDLMDPATLRVKQPGLVSKLYGGMQCSNCSVRFPPEHTARYSQHLDWHFRQNRRDRDATRRRHSRPWHYNVSNWKQHEELEDLEQREKSWFEAGGAIKVKDAGSPGATEAPSVAASGFSHTCALCGDPFQQFYNDEKEEWHLRNALKHVSDFYHPLCFEEYKASLSKGKPPTT